MAIMQLTDEDKARYKKALSGARSDISATRRKLPWERGQGGTEATRGGPKASGSAEAEMDAKDGEPKNTEQSADPVAETQGYEKAMRGSASGRSGHLVEGSETSANRKNSADEGDTDYVGSIERQGSDSDDPSQAIDEKAYGYKPNKTAPTPGHHQKRLAPHSMGKKPF
jgi:hypothetical protein